MPSSYQAEVRYYAYHIPLNPHSTFLTPTSSNQTPESTSIALLARLGGLLEPLREFSRAKPVWGTCAGAILLSKAVENTKKGGQELLGGVSVTTARNGFGPQVCLHHWFFLRRCSHS